jgi:outer membrane protein assembly factor BamB
MSGYRPGMRFPLALLHRPAWAALTLLAFCGVCLGQTVATFHGGADRSGNFTVPELSWARARTLRLDPNFAPRFAGHVYAQPLYRQGVLFVATESDTVVAIDARSGRTLWTRSLGRPVALSRQPCGNIDPLGVTGTPAIDEASQTLYLDAMVAEADGAHHRIFALALENGAVRPGWPVDVGAALGRRFIAADQNERGALLIQGGRVYVPYGGHFGDCGEYRGWVVGIGLKNPRDIVSWSTRARGGGIWAPGGIAGDGRSLYVATGNTFGAREWSDGEAVFRLAPNLAHSDRPQDYFAPPDWRALDARDLDLGGANPLLLQLPAPGGMRALVPALGKDRRAYLLDAANLGGIGGSLAARRVADEPIRTAPASFPASGGAFVALPVEGAECPAPRRGNGLTVLAIRAGPSASIATAWCAALDGGGSPMVTTTDGHSQPIVWVLGADGDNRLHGYRGDTGELLFTSAPLAGLHHFQTLLPAAGRLYVAADGRVYAFSY